MQYINQIISLSKKSPQEPFKIQYKYLDSIDVLVDYLPDGKIWLDTMSFQDKKLLKVDKDSFKVLEIIFQSIESYPYTWDLNGVKLDTFGFDVYLEGNNFSFSPTALKRVQDHIGYKPDSVLEEIYSQPEFVYSPHLTKLSIEFEKTSVFSEFAIQLHSVYPVRIASFVYESSLNGSGQVKKINLEALEIEQSNEHIVISFGEAIVAKRVTLVLAQDNLSEVIAISENKKSEEENYLYSLIEKYAKVEGENYG